MSFLPFRPRVVALLLVCSLFIVSLPLVAQPMAQAGDCLPSQFIGYQSAVVTPGDPNNVRAEPSASAELVGRIPPGLVFNVTGTEESVCADGYLWTYVSAPHANGWTVEANADTYFFVPYGIPIGHTIAERPADGGDMLVEMAGIAFVVPAQLSAVTGVTAFESIGNYQLDYPSRHPSGLGFSMEGGTIRALGGIGVSPYAGLEDYWLDGAWLETLLREQPLLAAVAQEHDDTLPELPRAGNGLTPLFHGLPTYVTFASGTAIRYISAYSMYYDFDQGTNLSVSYQGLTADRAFVVGASFSIRVPLEAMPPRARDAAGRDAYFRQLEANLAAQPTSAFTPDLALFDALFASITITDAAVLNRAIP